jgi:hypothetical protein
MESGNACTTINSGYLRTNHNGFSRKPYFREKASSMTTGSSRPAMRIVPLARAGNTRALA